MNISELNKTADTAFPEIKTSLSSSTIMKNEDYVRAEINYSNVTARVYKVDNNGDSLQATFTNGVLVSNSNAGIYSVINGDKMYIYMPSMAFPQKAQAEDNNNVYLSVAANYINIYKDHYTIGSNEYPFTGNYYLYGGTEKSPAIYSACVYSISPSQTINLGGVYWEEDMVLEIP